ncbi:MAG: GNAT family N-acetyltransferase [Bacteroidales bacterium]|nr:GNAT family N-acetyltransferase [Bacteroidales bacterium]
MHFYLLPKEYKECRLPDSFHIEVVKNPIHHLRALKWVFFSVFNLKEYRILYKNQIVAVARVVPKIWNFTFMPKNSYTIIACSTQLQYRGRGLYASLLQYIVSENRNNNTPFYIFASSDNHASIKGIEKAGGCLIGYGKRTRFGFYKITQQIKNEL